MTTAIDTNVIITLWEADATLSASARLALEKALEKGHLVIAAPVFAELMAAPGRDETFLDSFFRNTGIRIDWMLEEDVWRTAGEAFQAYAARRKRQRDPGPRRILADFLIGAHALRLGYRLLTLDNKLYRAAFPNLLVVEI
jgi:predicted nucleic acid-binding protein